MAEKFKLEETSAGTKWWDQAINRNNKKVEDVINTIIDNDSTSGVANAELVLKVNDIESALEVANSELNENTQKNSYFITPEMYGAKGDGITDDTDAIQQSFDYCKNNSLVCRFTSGKTYCISKTLTVTGLFYVEFNNAWVKTLTPLACGIEINIADDNLNTAQCYFRGLNLNCSNIDIGVKVTKAKRIYLENLLIRYAQQVGLQLDSGYEITVSHCNFTGTTPTNKAIVVNATDNYIHHCFGINNNKFIENNAEGNVFESNHAWIIDNTILANSIFIDLRKDALVSNCISDTYYIAFQCNSSGASRIIGNSLIINTTYYKKDLYSNPPMFINFIGNPYVFNTTIANNYISFPDKNVTGYDVYGNLYNLDKKNVCCNIYGNTGYNVGLWNYVKEVLVNESTNITTRKSYAIRKNGRVKLTAYFSNTTIPTTDTTVFMLPEYMRPFDGFYCTWAIGNDLNSLSSVGYGYVDSSGKVIIKNCTGVTTFTQGVLNVEFDVWTTGIS